MNNPIKLLISGADMGGLIASCALRHDFHESSRHTDGFQIYRIPKIRKQSQWQSQLQ